MSHASSYLTYAFHLLSLTRALVRGASFREIAGDLREAQQFAIGAFDGVDYDASPKSAFVLADPPPFGFVFSGPRGSFESPLRYAFDAVLRGIKCRKMLP